jgi:stage II sporulation protein M
MMETAQPQHWSWKQLIPYIVLAAAFFAVTIWVGMYIPEDITKQIMDELKQSTESLHEFGPLVLFIIIFLNNAFKSFTAIALGVFIGIPPVFFIATNGLTVGVVLAASKIPNAALIAAALAPHGIIEIPALIVSTALGMSIGIEAVRFLTRKPSMTRNQLRYSMKVYMWWILPGLLIAALIEVFVTPLVISSVSGQPLPPL